MGVPTVATNVRGCRQVVDGGVTGLLVTVRDAATLAAAIASLADVARAPARMGLAAAARRRTREFDDRRCVDITLDTYRRLLARRAPSLPAPTP